LARYSSRYWQKPTLRHYIEFIAVWPLVAALKSMPVDWSSNLLAATCKLLGPSLPASNRIRENIQLVWPSSSQTRIEEIVKGVWDNFARVPNEYWNLEQIRKDQDDRIEIVGTEHLETLRQSGKSGIFFTAHMGNWEMITLVLQKKNLPLTVVYRPANNPLVDACIRDWQRASGVELIMKGRDGARRLIKVLDGQRHTIMLVDVRMNDGIRVPFLGLNAMTPSAPAALALRSQSLLVPVRAERTGSSHFRVIVEKPWEPLSTDNRVADIQETMTWVNGRISQWIEERPEQWMWLHRRWGKNPVP